MQHFIKIFCLLAGIIILAAPVSGFDFGNKLKNRTVDVGLPDTIVDQLGNLTYSMIIKKSKITIDTDKKEMVERVIQQLIQAAQKGEYAKAANAFQWEVTIVEAPLVADAKVFPGGKIIIYSGLFKVVKIGDNQYHDAQMATFLGHEMGHALARHAAQRFDRDTRAAIMTAVAGGGAITADFDLKTTIAIMGAMGVGYAGAMAPPFQKQHEFEADEIGVTIMARAGFDPNQAIVFFQNLKDKLNSSESIKIMSNHPSVDTRIAALQKMIPQLAKN